MKRYFSILLAAALLLVGCAKDAETMPAPDNTKNTLSFTYDSHHNATRGVAPSVPEKTVHDMAVYVCSGGQFVRQLEAGVDYTDTPNADNTRTIDMTRTFISEFIGQTAVFYFTANNTASTGGTHIPTGFSGTQQQFEDLRSTPLDDSPLPWVTGAELIETSTTKGLLMTAKSAEIRVAGKRSVDITLRRRVARFDIENPAAAGYAINMIYVSNAKIQAPMFEASGADHSDINVRSLEDIYGSGTKTFAEGVFYLYPTDLSTTTIVAEVENTSTHETALFTLDTSGLKDLYIDANTRYIIKFDETTLQLGVGSGDWG